ncbi:MAG: protein kinase [Myxococcota bacterium]
MKRGDRLGEFVLRQPIGVGAQGRVWRAQHVQTGEEAAIKVVGRHHGGRTHTWTAELNALARLDHPNIARVHDYGLLDEPTDEYLDGAAWIAMELCAWPFDRVADTLETWDATLTVLRAIAAGLAHAHARGVIHRDLKPGNLLLGGREPRIDDVKIVDFGIAVMDGATLRRARGTPAYMAPEQFSVEPHRLGPWTDLYSLGMVAWLLVTGMRPFPPMDPASLLLHKRGLVLEPFLPRFEVPEDLEDLLVRLLHPDVGSRFLCVADLMAALDALSEVTVAATAGPGPDPALLPTVPALPPQDVSPEVPALAPVPPTPRPALWTSPPAQPRMPGPLDGLRDPPFEGREAERDALWARLVPGARVALTGPGALELARWALRAMREQTGHLALSVEGHTSDAPGSAALRILDEALGHSGSGDREAAAHEALARYRANFGAAESALGVLLGSRGQSSVVRNGALASVLGALAKARGLFLFVGGTDRDRDLAGLVARIERAAPDVALVTVDSRTVPAVGWTTLAVPASPLPAGPATREPFDPLAGLRPSERSAVEHAAVLGTVERSVWADIVTLTPGALLGLEDELVRRGVARRRPGGWVFRDPGLEAELRERLEDSGRLQSASAAAADALDVRDDDPVRRGRLWLAGGHPGRAVHTWLREADRIEDTHGRRASIDLWGFARVVAHELPLSEPLHGELETRHLAGMVMLLDRRDEAGELAQVHQAIFEERGWVRSAALCCWVRAVAAGTPNPGPAFAALDDGLALLEGRDGDRDITGRLWGMRFRLSHEHATGEHLDDLRRSRDALVGLEDARSRLLFRRMAGLHAQMSGDLDTAIERFAEQVQIARTERPTALPEAIVQHAVALSMAGDTSDRLQSLLEEALDLATFGESAHQAAYASINLMTLALKRDDFRRGAEMAARTLDFARHSPHAALACHLGLALCAVGLRDPAAPSAWKRAREGLQHEHIAEADFLAMLLRIAELAEPPIAAEAAALATLERARLEAP